ncbi:hypothetical protein H0A36_22790 [Endozoicomonas sp. SM1973]|uniref:PEP-CTERM protein-sorting domain-containing protein n=1 Tax=Spartinivicinus marinus TaxID=2994442 RepID=A0A853I4L3_9GAMM|nr:hypothetical protein [Spartinivicinus marinus]MCX4025880.1 hypothetical protein [Spartinivicinus marinus]NYZ68850.1 hypothetical protein [Spartinivicinus marinus]
MPKLKLLLTTFFSCLLVIPFYTAQAGLITPDSATASGMTFAIGSANGFIDGNTSSQVYVNPYKTGAYIEFSFSNYYLSDSIRLYNDYSVNDDSIIKFNLAFYNDSSLVALEKDLLSPTAVATHDIAYSTTAGPFNRVRLFPTETQLPNRFQVREIQFSATEAIAISEPPLSLLMFMGLIPFMQRRLFS